MMPDEPTAGLCYLPSCDERASWRVTDTASTIMRDACVDHMPRAVVRIARKATPLVVAPLFVVESAADVVPLLTVGAQVYGMVGDPTAALAFGGMSDQSREVVRAALSGSHGLEVDPADVIPFPDSWERHEGPEA